MILKIGITGTRKGGTPEQLATMRALFLEYLDGPCQLSHGLCEGIDEQAHDLAHELFGYDVEIHGHPGPEDDKHQVKSLYQDCDTFHEHKTHFARNRDIVNECEILFAFPAEMELQDHGGTAYTINFARKKGVPCKIVWPDGTVEG
jgi:hypothetical protein